MSKNAFKKSLLDVIECLIQAKLSNSSIQLISYYFNNSKSVSIKDKAEETIKRYLEKHLDTELPKHSNKLKDYIEIMLIEAEKWENEIKEYLKKKEKHRRRS